MTGSRTSGARLFGSARAVNPLKFDRKPAPAPMSTLRRKLIAMVHIAKKDLELIDDDYRAILMEEAGVASAADADEAGLAKAVDRFKARGWVPALADGKKAAPKPADFPGAGKARALWISLHQLGVIENPAEPALEAFACRQLGCTKFQWAVRSQLDGLIEALKAMAMRHGWEQSLKGVASSAAVVVLKRRLVERQLAILVEAGWAPASWDVKRAAFDFGGVEIPHLLGATASQLDLVAQALGKVIWQAKAKGAVK